MPRQRRRRANSQTDTPSSTNQANKSCTTVASLSSFLGFFEVAAYTASKSAVAGLTRALAVEWAPAGVTVSEIVFPPATDLKQIGQEQPLAVFEHEFVEWTGQGRDKDAKSVA